MLWQMPFNVSSKNVSHADNRLVIFFMLAVDLGLKVLELKVPVT